MTGAPLPGRRRRGAAGGGARSSAGGFAVSEAVPAAQARGRASARTSTRATWCCAPGRRLRPQDVGVLASLGVARPCAACAGRACDVVVTGDELLPAGSRPRASHRGQQLGRCCAALVARDGGVPLPFSCCPTAARRSATALADADADVVLVSGGWSVGQEDHAPRLVAELGS